MKCLANRKISTIVFWAVTGLATLLYGVLVFILYRNYPDYDIVAHIRIAIEPGFSSNDYSLLHPLIRFIHWVTPGHVGIVVAILLTVSTIASIFLTYVLLQRLAADANRVVCMAAAWMCNFTMALVLPGLDEMVYLGTYTSSIWHNPTYIILKPLALLSLLAFIRLEKDYAQKITLPSYLIFAAVLFVATWIKPNFTVAFALAVGCMLLVDLIIARGKNIAKVLLLGTAVLPSGFLILWQSFHLFDESQSIGFGVLAVTGYYTSHPYLGFVRSIAFPFLALVLLWKNRREKRIYNVMGATGLFGLAVGVFMHETGSRFSDGNMLWTGYMGLFMLFLMGAALLCGETSALLQERPAKHAALRWAIVAVLWLLLLWHVLGGIYYFRYPINLSFK